MPRIVAVSYRGYINAMTHSLTPINKPRQPFALAIDYGAYFSSS